MIFTGQSELVIDAKGRIAVPARYRQMLDPDRDGAGLVCIPWAGGVIRVYTPRTFESLAARSDETLTPSADEAELEASLFPLAETLSLDSAGRINLDKQHLALTGLSGEVMMLGMRNRLEICDRAAWLARRQSLFTGLPKLIEKVEEQKRGRPRPA